MHYVPTMTYNVTPQLAPNGLTVAELFAGGGLMAVGLRAAGYNLVWANDFDRNAVKAYRHNLGDHIVHGDITAIDPADIPDTDVIAGGPPCQDYSVAGTGAGENGERGKLVWAYLRIIEAKRPKAFIFENVKGLITKKHRPTFDALIAKFEEIGYNVSSRLINAWDYGVAQKRERVFIVGIREDLGFTFEFPEPSPEDYRTKVLRDVIGDLPEPSAQVNGKCWIPKSEYTYDQANRVQSWDKPSATIPAHHNSGQPIHPQYANHGETLKLERDPEILPQLPESITNRGVGKMFPDVYWQNYAKASAQEPGLTVSATGKPRPHPNVPRRFTVRECLRIQSVPDWYVLPDDLSLSAQYRIVGNGVASRVAYLLGIALAEQLHAATDSSVIGERLIPGTGTPDGRVETSANGRKEAV
jgi:DNA (cytosine-5)-methyltransferase 1